jgi:hypothetical protein
MTVSVEGAVFMFSTSVQPLSDLLQSYTSALCSITSLNCALSLIRILAGFMFSLVRNLTVICCVTAEGTICSLIMITTDRKQVYTQ